MTEPTRHHREPTELPLWVELEPAPVDGCDVCGALARERKAARFAGDGSKVSDCNVEIRRHPHGKGVRRR